VSDFESIAGSEAPASAEPERKSRSFPSALAILAGSPPWYGSLRSSFRPAPTRWTARVGPCRAESLGLFALLVVTSLLGILLVIILGTLLVGLAIH
jgi:hypothetical protein